MSFFVPFFFLSNYKLTQKNFWRLNISPRTLDEPNTHSSWGFSYKCVKDREQGAESTTKISTSLERSNQ